MKSNQKTQNIENIYAIYSHSKYQRKLPIYLIITTCILLAITAQSIVFLLDGPLSDILDTVLKSEIQENCIIQAIVSPSMILLQTIVYKLSARSQRALKLFRLLRLLLQIGYVAVFLEITVLPLENLSGISNTVLSAVYFIELLFLCLAYMVFEQPSLDSVVPFAYANIMFIARCSFLHVGFFVPFIITAVIISLVFVKNRQIERKLFDEFYFLRHDGEIYQSFLNLLPEGVAILTEEQQLTYINSSINRILDCGDDDILSRLLDLKNVDVVEGEKKVSKGKKKNEFQKVAGKNREEHRKNTENTKRKLIAEQSLQSEDAAIFIEEGQQLPPSKQMREHSRNDLIDDLKSQAGGTHLDISRTQFSRAKTYDIPKKKKNLDSSFRRLKAANTLQVPEAYPSMEESQMIARSRIEYAESRNQSPRSANPNQSENQYLAESNTYEKKNSSNQSPLLSDQNSFTKKRHYKLYEKKLTPDISFLGPMYAGHGGRGSSYFGGAALRSHSLLMSQPSQYKSHSRSPSGQSMDFSGENGIVQKEEPTSTNQATPDKDSHDADKHQQQHQQQFPSVFTLNNVSKKSEGEKTSSQPFKSFHRTTSRLPGTFTCIEAAKQSEGPKKLTSYETKLKDMRSTCQSIMRRLKEDMKYFEEVRPREAKKKWSFSTALKFFKRLLSFPKRQDIDSSYMARRHHDEEFRFNLEEENYCIIINSKLKNKEGERALEINLTPTILNQTPYILVLVKDTTERDLVSRLKETNNYKNTIMASVSHELRTPLNCIIAMQDMLRQNVSEELANKYLNPAINSSKLLLSLVNDILDFGQIRAGIHQHYYDTFSLKDVLQEALALFEIPARNRNLELKLDWDPKIPQQIYSDPSRIRQIVINLLNNAVKFTYKGSITLKAVYKGSQKVCIMVIDTGVGIKEEDVQKIFQAFGKLENDQLNPQGVGLGLTISQSLAHRLGPKGARGIKVRSEYSKGSCFYFTIENRAKDRKTQSDAKDRVGEKPSREQQIIRSQTRQEADKEDMKPEKGHSLCELDESFADEAGTIVQKMDHLNTLGQLKKSNMPSDIPGSYRSDPGDKENPQIQAREDNSEESSNSNQESHVEYTRVHDQRVLDTISLQIQDSQLPMNLVGSKGHQPKIQISIHPPDTEALGLEHKMSSKSRHKSPQPKSTLTHLEKFLLVSEGEQGQQLTLLPTNPSMKNSNVSTNLSRELKNCVCENVLIVDDNDFNLLALKQLLESLQFRVATAHNGEIAINIVKEKAKNSCCNSFMIVFMDCDMPVKDGFETTKELRSLQKKNVIPHFPIIAATAFVNEREVKRCFESGMDEYLNKPVKKDKVQDVIKKWCKK